MDMRKDQLPVQVPEGWTLVQVGPTRKTADLDWYHPVPEFDPQSDVERIWSGVMKWPRYIAVGFLYLTWTWKRSAIAAVVCGAMYGIYRAYNP